METVALAHHEVLCEWGQEGLAALAHLSDVVIIVDVLSFSTCVDVAVSRGATILPIAWKDSRASEFAAAAGAELAGPRGRAKFSLSPASFQSIERGTRVVLPSPNGATLSLRAGDRQVIAGCLRNAAVVAQAAGVLGKRILVVPAGEQWPDGSLRPCLEDWLGAGAILDGVPGELSPESEAARSAFRAARSELPRLIRDCMSGQELIKKGFPQDVYLAAELNVSDAVSVFQNGMYQNLQVDQVNSKIHVKSQGRVK